MSDDVATTCPVRLLGKCPDETNDCSCCETLTVHELREHQEVLEALLEEAMPYIAPKGHVYTAEDAGVRLSIRDSIRSVLAKRRGV